MGFYVKPDALLEKYNDKDAGPLYFKIDGKVVYVDLHAGDAA